MPCVRRVAAGYNFCSLLACGAAQPICSVGIPAPPKFLAHTCYRNFPRETRLLRYIATLLFLCLTYCISAGVMSNVFMPVSVWYRAGRGDETFVVSWRCIAGRAKTSCLSVIGHSRIMQGAQSVWKMGDAGEEGNVSLHANVVSDKEGRSRNRVACALTLFYRMFVDTLRAGRLARCVRVSVQKRVLLACWCCAFFFV